MGEKIKRMASFNLQPLRRNEVKGKIKRPGSFNWQPYVYSTPTLIVLALWFFFPLFKNLGYAFYNWNLLPTSEPQFVGLTNFTTLFNHPDFWVATKNTVFYTLALLPFTIVVPLFIAASTQNMNQKIRYVYRAILILPLIIPPVVVSTVFSWLLNPTNGIVNNVLMNFNVLDAPITFFTDERFARWTILLITAWKMLGFSTLTFSTALAAVNKDYYEAASLDGASKFKQFFDITIPLISPTVLFMVMMTILFGGQWTFAFIDILTEGGPYGMTTNFYYLMYEFAFEYSNVGLSAATSMVFMAFVGGLAVALQFIRQKIVFFDN